jgi:hypothetical protein
MNVFNLFIVKTSQSIQTIILNTCFVHFLGNFVHTCVFILEGVPVSHQGPLVVQKVIVLLLLMYIDIMGWRGLKFCNGFSK